MFLKNVFRGFCLSSPFPLASSTVKRAATLQMSHPKSTFLDEETGENGTPWLSLTALNVAKARQF